MGNILSNTTRKLLLDLTDIKLGVVAMANWQKNFSVLSISVLPLPWTRNTVQTILWAALDDTVWFPLKWCLLLSLPPNYGHPHRPILGFVHCHPPPLRIQPSNKLWSSFHTSVPVPYKEWQSSAAAQGRYTNSWVGQCFPVLGPHMFPSVLALCHLLVQHLWLLVRSRLWNTLLSPHPHFLTLKTRCLISLCISVQPVRLSICSCSRTWEQPAAVLYEGYNEKDGSLVSDSLKCWRYFIS